MKTGSIRADFKLYPNSKTPSFDCAVRVRDAQLEDWESLLRAYPGLGLHARAQLDAELEARDGRRVEPVLSDVDDP